MNPEYQALIAGLLEVATLINSVVCGGALAALIVVLSCALGKRDFKVMGVDVHVKHFFLVTLGLTAAHAYTTWLFVLKVQKVLQIEQVAKGAAWHELVNKGGLIFSEMTKRSPVCGAERCSTSVYLISGGDPAAWLTLAFAAATIIATTVTLWETSISRISRSNSFLLALLLGSTIGLANWLIGSQWAIYASHLAP